MLKPIGSLQTQTSDAVSFYWLYRQGKCRERVHTCLYDPSSPPRGWSVGANAERVLTGRRDSLPTYSRSSTTKHGSKVGVLIKARGTSSRRSAGIAL